MGNVFYKHGNASVGVSDELNKLVNNLLDANPIIKRTLQDAVEDIYAAAYKQWPVRVEPPKSAKSKMITKMKALQKEGKSKKQSFAIVKNMESKGRFFADDASQAKISLKSEDSKNKLQRGIIIENDEIVAFVRNTADYAWAIKTGQYTLNNLAFNTRTSNTLLWSPMKKEGDRLVDVLADDLINIAKKG